MRSTFQRLELIAPDLSRRLGRATASQLRDIRAAVCHLAVCHVRLDDQIINEALSVLDGSRPASPTLCQTATERVDQLDLDYFTLQESADEGRASQDDVRVAFRRARAASAVAIAIAGPDADTTRETIYEAAAATENVTELESLADAIFTKTL